MTDVMGEWWRTVMASSRTVDETVPDGTPETAPVPGRFSRPRTPQDGYNETVKTAGRGPENRPGTVQDGSGGGPESRPSQSLYIGTGRPTGQTRTPYRVVCKGCGEPFRPDDIELHHRGCDGKTCDCCGRHPHIQCVAPAWHEHLNGDPVWRMDVTRDGPCWTTAPAPKPAKTKAPRPPWRPSR